MAEPAVGTYTHNRVDFRGTSYRFTQVRCSRWSRYNLDDFSGEINAAIQEFQSVNNDGGRDRDEPYVFRRVQCAATRDS